MLLLAITAQPTKVDQRRRLGYFLAVAMLATCSVGAEPILDEEGHPEVLVDLAIRRALGEESQKFEGKTFKGIELGDEHPEEAEGNSFFEAPQWLSVAPHKPVEKNGRIESTRVFVEKESNRIVMISAEYDGTPIADIIPDLLEVFGRTPQESLKTEWIERSGPAQETILRYTFPKTVVRIVARDFTARRSLTQVWVFDRKFLEKSLLSYGKSVFRACKWLKGMRELADQDRIDARNALPIEGCEIRKWDDDKDLMDYRHFHGRNAQLLLYVDTKRKEYIDSVFKAAGDDFPQGLGRGGRLQPFDVAMVASTERATQLIVCPDASTSMRPPELKSYVGHLDGTILRSPISDVVNSVTSDFVQVFFPPVDGRISIVSRSDDTFWEPIVNENPYERSLRIGSRAGGDRTEWTYLNGWEVRVTNWGAISLSKKKSRGL